MRLHMMSMGMFVPFLSVLFMVGVWKCHYDVWFCTRDHFDATNLCVGGIHVVPDDVYWDVWVIHLSAIHGGVLDMASLQLRLSQGQIWYIGTLSGIVQIHL